MQTLVMYGLLPWRCDVMADNIGSAWQQWLLVTYVNTALCCTCFGSNARC